MCWQSSAAITTKRQSRVEHNDSFKLNVFLCEEELSAAGLTMAEFFHSFKSHGSVCYFESKGLLRA